MEFLLYCISNFCTLIIGFFISRKNLKIQKPKNLNESIYHIQKNNNFSINSN